VEYYQRGEERRQARSGERQVTGERAVAGRKSPGGTPTHFTLCRFQLCWGAIGPVRMVRLLLRCKGAAFCFLGKHFPRRWCKFSRQKEPYLVQRRGDAAFEIRSILLFSAPPRLRSARSGCMSVVARPLPNPYETRSKLISALGPTRHAPYF
jgi:hypothetical protein